MSKTLRWPNHVRDDYREIQLANLNETVHSMDGSSSTRLLLHLPIHPDETLRSYLARVSIANGLSASSKSLRLSSYPTVSKESGQKNVSADKATRYVELSERVGLSVPALAAADRRTYGPLLEPSQCSPGEETTVPILDSERLGYSKYVRFTSGLAFCPHCLADRKYERANWASLYSLYCREHQCYLLLNCTQCENPIDPRSLAAGVCTYCGFILEEMFSMRVPPEFERLRCQKLVEYLWTDSESEQPASIPRVDKATLFMVLHGLIKLLLLDEFVGLPKASPRDFKNIIRSPSPVNQESLAQTLIIAYRALADWPYGFESFLHYFRQRTGLPYGQAVGTDMGRLNTHYFMREWADDRFEFIQEAYEDYLFENYRFSRSIEKLSRYNDRPAFRERFQFVSSTEAARRLGISVKAVGRLATLGNLKVASESQRRGHPELWVSISDVERLRRLDAPDMKIADCASMLGVSEVVVHDLVRVGILKSQECEDDTGCKTIMGESLRRLRLRLLTIKEPDESATVPIAEAQKILETYGWGYGEITRAILDGRLRAVGKVPSSFDLHIHKRDMYKLQRKLAQNQFRAGAKRLALATGVRVKHVGNWIDAGLLEHVMARRGSPFDLSSEELSAFMEKYISYKAAADIIGIPWPTLVDHARSGRIRSVGPANRLRTTGLLYREDVERWSPEHTMTAAELVRTYAIDAQTLGQLIWDKRLLPICGRGVDNRDVRLFVRSEVDAYFSELMRST